MENSDKELDAIIAEELGISPGKLDTFKFLDLDEDAWDYANEVEDLKYEL